MTLNLTKRGKWLTGIAALIAAYVVFGPKDSGSVEPAKAAARPAAHTTHAVTSTLSVPVARSLLALAHRVVDPTAAGALPSASATAARASRTMRSSGDASAGSVHSRIATSIRTSG